MIIVNVSADENLAELSNQQKLEAFFATSAGLKSLSNSGDPATVEILDTLSSNGVFFVHTRDNTGPLIPDTIAEQWRGFFVVSGRMVTVTMVNFVDNPIPDSIVFSHLEEFAARTKSLNAPAQ